MKQIVVHAEFSAENLRSSISVDHRQPEAVPQFDCRMHCSRGPFVCETVDFETEESDQPSRGLKEPAGLAYLDIVFRETLKGHKPTLTDLVGDGRSLELTVEYPLSFLGWFQGIVDEIKLNGGVLRFFGWMDNPRTRAAGTLAAVPDAIGRLSDRDFDSISLMRRDPKIGPLSHELWQELVGGDT